VVKGLELRIGNGKELGKERNRWRQVVVAAMGLNGIQNAIPKRNKKMVIKQWHTLPHDISDNELHLFSKTLTVHNK